MTRDDFMKDPVLLWLKADRHVDGEWVTAAYRASQQMNDAVVGHLVRSISRVGNLSQAKETAETMKPHLSVAEVKQLKELIALDLVEDLDEWRADFKAIFQEKDV